MHVKIANLRWRGNVRGIPSACTTYNVKYLISGLWRVKQGIAWNLRIIQWPGWCWQLAMKHHRDLLELFAEIMQSSFYYYIIHCFVQNRKSEYNHKWFNQMTMSKQNINHSSFKIILIPSRIFLSMTSYKMFPFARIFMVVHYNTTQHATDS